MASSKSTTTLAEREKIVKLWESKKSDSEISQALKLSIATVRKWRRKYQKQGRAGLASHMGRPATGALGQFSFEIRQALKELRQKHAGWGPQTLRIELPRYLPNIKRCPSCPRIAVFLKEAGLSRQYEKHSALPEPRAVKASAVHEEWEMDAQGEQDVNGIGKVSIINIADVISRLKVDSLPCLQQSHPDTAQYQFVLRRSFMTYGLPQRISLDHDSVFIEPCSASPFPTSLHLWLMALGVEVRFIKKRPPVEHSLIERHHQTITAQALAGQTYQGKPDLQKQLHKRLEFLNHDFPSGSLNGRAPLQAYPQAKHSGRVYHWHQEETLLDLSHVYNYLAHGKWFRLVSPQGQISLAGQRYGIGTPFKKKTLEITFDPTTLQFVAISDDATQTIQFPPMGLTKQDLMGELALGVALPACQLPLPLSPQTARQTLLFQAHSATTL